MPSSKGQHHPAPVSIFMTRLLAGKCGGDELMNRVPVDSPSVVEAHHPTSPRPLPCGASAAI